VRLRAGRARPDFSGAFKKKSTTVPAEFIRAFFKNAVRLKRKIIPAWVLRFFSFRFNPAPLLAAPAAPPHNKPGLFAPCYFFSLIFPFFVTFFSPPSGFPYFFLIK